MLIVGCDFHPTWQQIAVFDSETAEIKEHKPMNGNGEAERFYRSLAAPVLVGRAPTLVPREGSAIPPSIVNPKTVNRQSA